MAIGIVAIVIGCVAIIYPAVASVGTAIFVGWILMIIGVFMVAAAFARRRSAASAAAAGLGLPDLHRRVLARARAPRRHPDPDHRPRHLLPLHGADPDRRRRLRRGQRGAGLVGLSGVAGLLIGILVLAKLPSSADWAIGLLVGIDLIFAGWTLVSVALVGKDLSRPAAA